MCWSEEASFVSFAVGTVLNVACYFYLWRENGHIRAHIAWWQYALCMQIPEGVAWRAIDAGDDDALLVASRAAMVLNVTQPAVLLVTIYVAYGRPPLYALVALFYYALVLSVEAGELAEGSRDISPREGCSHLDLGYWDNTRALVYVSTPLVLFSAIPSVVFSTVNAGIYALSLIVAYVRFSCGAASVWCWIIVGAAPCLLLVHVAGHALIGADFADGQWSTLRQRVVDHVSGVGVSASKLAGGLRSSQAQNFS